MKLYFENKFLLVVVRERRIPRIDVREKSAICLARAPTDGAANMQRASFVTNSPLSLAGTKILKS